MKTLPKSPQYGLPRARAASLLAALALLTLAIACLACLACAPRARVLPPPGAAPPVAGPVHRVLFIHGYRGETWYWDRFWLAALRFLPANCEAYIVTGLPAMMGTTAAGPEAPLAALEAWLEAQAIPYENLHLVSHSLGGLLARRFVTAHPGAVRQVFLLGVPSGGVSMLGALNPGGWCTPAGIADFNAANPPDPRVKWYVLAGNRFQDGSGGAVTEPYPNDGVVSLTSVLEFVRLCGDSVTVDWAVLPLTHPTWNWGENLLESKRSINWVIERLRADVEAAVAAPPAAPAASEPPAAPAASEPPAAPAASEPPAAP